MWRKLSSVRWERAGVGVGRRAPETGRIRIRIRLQVGDRRTSQKKGGEGREVTFPFQIFSSTDATVLPYVTSTGFG
jgi:hypothetical protein